MWVWNWIVQNKQWVFDGFGIEVLAALGTVLGWAIKKFKTAALFDKVGELFNRKTAKIYVHPIGKPVWHAAVQPSGAVYMQVIIQARINHDSFSGSRCR
jgi:hypothetical protein